MEVCDNGLMNESKRKFPAESLCQGEMQCRFVTSKQNLKTNQQIYIETCLAVPDKLRVQKLA